MNDEYDNEFVQSLNANKEMTGLSGKEFASLEKWKVFRPIAQTPNNIKPVGHKWVFVRKRNKNNEVVMYMARLVLQGFSQIPRVDYIETYSPIMDEIILCFL